MKQPFQFLCDFLAVACVCLVVFVAWSLIVAISIDMAKTLGML